MTLAEAYYIRLGGKVQGPFGIAELHRLAKRGRFSRLWEVSEDGITWHRASEFPELFPSPTHLPSHRPPTGPPSSDSEPIKPIDGDPGSGESPPPADEEGYQVKTELPQQKETASSPEPLWHYSLNGQEQTPVVFSTLQQLASTGRLAPNDFVWTNTMADWVEVRYVAGLASESEIKAVGEFQLGKVAPMAVASFLFGLAGISCLFFFGGIVAVVFGHIALKQIGESRDASKGRGLAIAGLVLGYFVLIVSAITGLVLLVVYAIQASSAPMG